MIDILIPTFNRSSDIEKNIAHLNAMMEVEGVMGEFRILVSDNCSTDATLRSLELAREQTQCEICVYRQETNIGLEKNAVFLLLQSDAEFVLYLGDDDFLPEDYLGFILQKIGSDGELASIVPGFSELYSDGVIKPARTADFDTRMYSGSFKSVLQLSYFGHQLSGVVHRRANLLDSYIENTELRNIYLFIFFLAYNNLRGNTYYAPKYQVLVSQNNCKDWAYDDSGLLTEIFKNYRILYPSDTVKRSLLCLRVAISQSWRLRIDGTIGQSVKAMLHIFRVGHVGLLVKIGLLFVYVYCYSKNIVSYIKRRM
jgi:abequosyltransferase